MPEPALPQPEDSAPVNAAAPDSLPATPPPARRRRRWVRRLAVGVLVCVLILALLIGFAPAIVSLPPVHNAILAVVNGRLQGTIAVEGLSLSWRGPLEIRGLRISDPEQQPVVQVRRVTADVGVWPLITSARALGEIVVDAPVVLIDQQRDGQVSLARAFQSRMPAPPASTPAGTLPPLQGRLLIRDGTAKMVRANAGSYEVTKLDAEADIKTLNDIAARFDLILADGSKLAGEATLQGPLSQGELNLATASGTLRLKTDGPVDVGPLAVLAGQAGLAGGVSVDLNAAIDAGALQGQVALAVTGLQSAQRAAASAAPIDAELQGQVRWADNQLVSNFDLSGAAGQARVALDYRHTEQPLNLTADRIMSAVLTGEPLALPDFSVQAHATVDIARLGQAAPELLGVRSGAELTGGRLEIAQLTVQGGAQPVVNAALVLKDLAARRGDQPVQLDTLTFNLDSALEPGQGLQLRQLELQSGFARVSASGLASDLRATFQTNLGELQRELNQVFDLGAFELAGTLHGQVVLKRADAERVDVTLQANAEQLRYADGARTLALPRAVLGHAGQLLLAGEALTRIVAQQTNVDLNGEFVASASGWYDVQQRGLQAALEISRGDLALLGGRAKQLGIGDLARYSGALQAQVGAERTMGTQPLLTRGALLVQNLGVDGKPVVQGETRLTWDGAQLAADGRSLQLATAKLDSAFARLTATDVRWQSGRRHALTGQINAAANVAHALQAIAPVARWEQPPELAGQLTLHATGTVAGDVLSFVGEGAVEQCVIGTGAGAIREPRVQFACDVKLEQDRQLLSLRKCQLASKLLTVDVAGKAADYTDQCQLNLRGSYSASWEALSALLHQLAPSTADSVRVAGTSASDFKITGPLRQSGVQPSFRGVGASVAVTWSAAELYGVKLGAANLAPVLKNGQATLRKTAIPVADGQANVAAVVDLAPSEPTLKLAKLQLLENVALTKELGAQLLGRINPVFMHVASIEGRVNLRVEDVLIPLGPSVKQRGAAQGRLDLRQVQMRPSGLLGELIALGGLQAGGAYPVQIGTLTFVMQDGRIRYDNLRLTFPEKFDLIFRGSVGLDDTLDLVVSVPVRAALLDRLGVKGPTLEHAQMLGGARVDIPLVGTRAQPRLDFAKVDVQSLLKDVLLKQPGKQIEDLLRGLPGDQRKRP